MDAKKAVSISESLHKTRGILDECVRDFEIHEQRSANAFDRYVVASSRLMTRSLNDYAPDLELRLRDAFLNAVGVVEYTPSDRRGIVVLGTWKVCEGVHTTLMISEPSIVTSSWHLTDVLPSAVQTYIDQLCTVSHSTHARDMVSVTEYDGQTVVRGRYASIVVGMMQAKGYPIDNCRCVLIHYRKYSLVGMVSYNGSTHYYTPSIQSQRILNSKKDPADYTTIGNDMLSVYAFSRDNTTVRVSSNDGVRVETGKNGNVGMSHNGILRYSAAPNYVYAAHARFYRMIMNTMNDKRTCAEFVDSGCIVPSL
ncbi:hypothetical protein BDV3_003341 [Batrachochytrium dendrobatidis]